MTDQPQYLNTVEGIPQGMTDTLNAVIDAYLGGRLRGLGLAAFITVPIPDTDSTGLVPVARIFGATPLLSDGVLGELRRLSSAFDDGVMNQRRQMVQAEQKAASEQRARKTPILDVNGAPLT